MEVFLTNKTNLSQMLFLLGLITY